MYNKFWILLLAFAPFSVLISQIDCNTDPSCRHTKEMLLEASRQWNNLPKGINTNKRSDTIDVLNYSVTLDMTDFLSKKIQGYCEVHFVARVNAVSRLQLDLLQMNIDSIMLGATKLDFNYNDTLIDIPLPNNLNVGDSAKVVVHYNGAPQHDKLWGGFYYKGDYAYNMGVGFFSDPHNYGRIWHPCFDNFVEKATYTFNIKTRSNKRAHCNGYLQSENTVDGYTTRVWILKDPIPTYLASIAVGDYTTVRQAHQGIDGVVPIELAANVADTNNLKKSFINLPAAIAAYEFWYGPHRWSKVGYSLVPFRSGAMEHATNISYPIAAADGSLRKESLMAHELGHSWWGNLVTCESATDMWVNEGMASYSVHLFWEYLYGRKRYLKEIKKNHYNVLNKAHIQEKGYRPVAAVPHRYTYGMHVYNKGASVVHNMRWYLGDSLFRKGLNYITTNYQFKNLNTAGFRDAMTFSTGVDMTSFFDDWLFLGGYPHFEIEKHELYKKGEGYKIKLAIHQKLVGRKVFCKNIPLQITFLDNNWNKHQAVIRVSGQKDSATIDLPFKPVSIVINEEHRLNQARYDLQLKLTKKQKGKLNVVNEDLGFYGFNIKAISDSAWLHMEHHPVAPDSIRVPDFHTISQLHYWSVKGIVPDNLNLEAVLFLDDKLDKDLMKSYGADSVVLLYRLSENDAWQEHPNYIKNQSTSLTGFTFSVLKGDYAFANAQIKPHIFKAQKAIEFHTFECNITDASVHLKIASVNTQKICAELYNAKGKCLHRKSIKVSKKEKTLVFPLKSFNSGIYFLKLRNANGKIIRAEKLVL